MFHDVRKVSARVWIYLRRKKGKSAILLGIFFTMALMALAGVTLSSAVRSSIRELREQFMAFLTIEPTLSEEYRVTPELAQSVVETVKPDAWSGMNVCYASVENITLIPGKYTWEEDEETSKIVRLVSCSKSEFAREFLNKTVSLTEGRHVDHGDEGKVVISDQLAQRNQLSIGDKISVAITENVASGALDQIGTRYEFEIVGIFEVAGESENVSSERAESEIYSNFLFTDEKVGIDIVEKVRKLPTQYANGITLWVNDPIRLEKMKQEVEEMEEYPWDKYFINTNSADYDRSAKPLEQMNWILNLFIGVILVIGAFILIILLAMWNRERMPEVGILISIGCSKKTILAELILENVILFAGGFVVAIPIVYLLAGILGSAMAIEGVALSVGTVFLVGICGVVLCAVVTACASIAAMRMKPREILTTIV